MAKIRVYELARDLNMTNKVLLDKIKDLDIDVKSHMSSIEDDVVAIIKSSILGKAKVKSIEEKRVRATVIRRRRRPTPEEKPDVKQEVEEAPEEAVFEEESLEEASETNEAQQVASAEEKQSEVTDIAQEKGQEQQETLSGEEASPPIVELQESSESKEEVSVESDVVQGIASQEAVQVPPSVDEQEDAEVPEEAVVSEEIKATKADTDQESAAPQVEETVIGKKEKTKKKKKQFAAKIIKLPDPEILKGIKNEGTAAAAAKSETLDEQAADTDAEVIGKTSEDEDLSKDAKKKGKKKKVEESEKDKKFFKKKISFRKKAVVEGRALYDDERGRTRKMRKGAKAKAVASHKTQITTPKAIKRRIKIDDTIILSELAKRMGIKASEMIAKLMALGVMATVNQTIDYETAVLVAAEFEYELERASFEEETVIQSVTDAPESLIERPPVVTIMGHVDHGKTSLLDVIRKSRITEAEAGGITQHIGAYHVDTENGQIVFLDTPGHEAFTAMRSRGAQITDIVILVVAADDGVMPQTVEAINHAKAAEVPIIVAVNKIDKEDADPERVKRELADHNIVSEDWGGENIFVNVSAKKEVGINELLDMILLQAEVLELKANPNKPARGHVIEAKLDSGRGPVATILVQEGTLHSGDAIVCGVHFGKIRAMLNDKGVHIDSAGPSIPVEILGLAGVPGAGDEMVAIEDEKNARQVSMHRVQKLRAKELAKSSRLSLEGLFEQMQEGEVKDLNLILKADVHGSIEALKDSLIKLSTDEVKVNIVHSATGTVTESDISLATVSNAIILGFNVRPTGKVHELAEEENVDMRFYDVIYNAIKDIKDAMVGMMDSTFKEQILGRAEIREVFVIPKKGSIAGSYILDGKIERGQLVRLLREGVIVYDGKISSLRRFKDDVKEVMTGYECGIGIENFNDLKIGDIIECYYMEEIRPELS